MTWRRERSMVAAKMLLVAGAALACQSSTSHAPTASGTQLSVANDTSIPVTLVVNGSIIETVPPGARDDPITATLPARPWSIEARSRSGRVLSTLSVSADAYISNSSGMAARVDLACGRLDVWSGPPLGGGTFIPDPSKPCT